MVKLNRIYTKTGDDGSTGLGDGRRVAKTDPRVAAYGTVDEANSSLGVAVIQCASHAEGPRFQELLRTIQNDLFDVGADLCCPRSPDEPEGKRLRITAAQTLRLEQAIDRFNEKLKPLDSFILPGGTPLAAALHVARTVVRRAERETVGLMALEAGSTNPETVRYLNRLSDLLFVLARAANSDGAMDIKWVPGASRTT